MNVTRRDLIRGMAVLGAGAVPARALFAHAAAAAEPQRFDLHHHYVTPEWLAALDAESKVRPISGIETFHGWSAAKAIAAMDQGGVARSILSTTTPGLWFGDPAQTRRLARGMNDYGAELVRTYKGRYGLFGVLPLPDAQASLPEIAYILDTLKADGISVLSSYDTKWLGDPSFAPVWAELDRRKAIVFSHATAPACCRALALPGMPAVDEGTVLEFNTDTARTIISLIESGTAAKYPNIRFIFSHAGGTITALTGRYFRAQSTAQALAAPAAPDSKLGILRRFYYDTAGSANPVQMQALKTIVPATQIVFGTDFPWGTPAQIAEGLAGCGFTDTELAGVNRDNALRLLPQYRA